MNISRLILTLTFLLIALAATEVQARKKKVPPPDTTHDGLVRVEKAKADLVYVLPGADLSGYDKVNLLEAYIAFHKDWQSYYNSTAGLMDHITDRDMEKMIERGKELFSHAFTDMLEKNGYPVVKEIGDDVLLVRPAVINVEVSVPDPDRIKGMGGGGIYTESAGSATLFIELYDSVSQQILARAFDSPPPDMAWRIPRDYSSNAMDARRIFGNWAKLLVKALDRAKAAKVED